MSACTKCECKEFSCSSWKPKTCKNCFHAKDEHGGGADPVAPAPAAPATAAAPVAPAENKAAAAPAPSTTIAVPAPKTPGKPSPVNPALSGSKQVKPKKHAKCLYDYQGTAPDQLTFKKDQVLVVTRQEGEWWECEDTANNKSGLVPSNFVELIKDEPATQAAATAAPAVVKAKCLYEYAAQQPDQLTFAAGDVLTVVEKTPGGWWMCDNGKGKKGLAPENFLKEEAPAAAPPAKQVEWVKCQYDYTGTQPDQLSFKQGDFLHVLEKSGDWWQTFDPVSEKKGLVPSNFVVPTDAAEAEAAVKKLKPTTTTASTTDPDFKKRLEEELAKERAESKKKIDELTKQVEELKKQLEEAKKSSAPAAPAKAEPKAEALYAYVRTADNQLSFEQGAQFTVLSQEGEWWNARDSTGKTGMVPSNFMKMLAEPAGQNPTAVSSTVTAPAASLVVAKGMYDFTPQVGMESTQLAFKLGEMLSITRQSGEWWSARNARGQSGDIPSNFVQLVPAGSPEYTTAVAALSGQAAPASATAPVVAAGKTVFAKGLFDFTAVQPDQLSFHTEEVLTIVSQEGDWWEAKNQSGHQGKIPHNYVAVQADGFTPLTNLTQFQQQPSFKYMDTAQFEAFALFDYSSSENNHMTFSKLESLSIVGRLHETEEWWVADKQGRKGIVPANFLVKVVGTCQATYEFTATNPATQISFHPGDRIKIVRRDDSGWWEGVHMATGQKGLFPSNYANPC